MKKLLIVLCLISLICKSYCSETVDSPLIIQASLHDTTCNGYNTYDGEKLYALNIDLVNTSSSTIWFWMMSCDWWTSFIFSSDRIRIMDNYDCDRNTSIVEHINSGQKLSFKFILGMLCEPKSTISNEAGKLGFVLIEENELQLRGRSFQDELRRRKDGKINIIWSEPLLCNMQ